MRSDRNDGLTYCPREGKGLGKALAEQRYLSILPSGSVSRNIDLLTRVGPAKPEVQASPR